MKELALAGSALGGWLWREGRCQLTEGQSSPSRDLAVISHCLHCQGEGLGAPPLGLGELQEEADPRGPAFRLMPQNRETANLGQQCGFGQPCSSGTL